MNQNINNKIIQLEKKLSQNTKPRSQPYLDTLHALGVAYMETGRQPEALQCFIRRVQLNPEEALHYCSLGWAYLHLGDFQKALQAYTEACNKSPGLIPALSGKADALYRLARYDDAYKLIQQLFNQDQIEAFDDCVAAFRVYTKLCLRYDDCDNCVSLIEKILTKSRISKETRLSLFFALASLLDRKGDYHQAYKYFMQANELTKLNYLQTADSEKNNVLIKAFSAETILLPLKQADNQPKPVFILGMPRSGTSLIEQILSRHPDVYAAGELGVLTEIANVLYAQCDYPATLEKLSEHVLNQAAGHYMSVAKKLAQGQRMITDKMPANYMHLGLISLLFPGATVIHAQRNPLDVCLSIYFQRFPATHNYATRLQDIAHYYVQYNRLMEHWQNVLPIKIHNINYEELVTEQEPVTRSLLESCQLAWHDDCLNFHESSRVVTTASQEQVKQQMYTTSINRWENYQDVLPEDFLSMLASSQEKYMKNLGNIFGK